MSMPLEGTQVLYSVQIFFHLHLSYSVVIFQMAAAPTNTMVESPAPTLTVFDSKDKLVRYAREYYHNNGIGITIESYTQDVEVRLQCDRGGKYKGEGSENAIRNRATRRIGCPFKLKGVRYARDNEWHLKAMNLNHNHQPSDNMAAHPIARRLTAEDSKRVELLSNAGIPPRKIKNILRAENERFIGTSKTIYNAKFKIKKIGLGDMSALQVLLDELTNAKYKINYTTDEDNHLLNLFFAPELSIKYLKQYNNVILMDSTYKTNRFGLPLLNVVGVNSNYRTFTIGLAFMTNESESAFTWVLRNIEALFPTNAYPKCIVTDRDLALMNASGCVFPNSKPILCKWHINKNITSRCKKNFETNAAWESFQKLWEQVCSSEGENTYNVRLNALKSAIGESSDTMVYLNNVWLPHKDRFVSYFVDAFMHLDQVNTSRVESAHAYLKTFIETSVGDILVTTRLIINAIKEQFHEIEAEIASDKIAVPIRARGPMYASIITKISAFALDKIITAYTEFVKRASPSTCSKYFSVVFGLPCPHVITQKIISGGTLTTSDFDKQWHIDFRDESSSSSSSSSIDIHFPDIVRRYEQASQPQQIQMSTFLASLAAAPLPILAINPRIPVQHLSETSTRRLPSAFERVETPSTHRRPPRCSRCGQIGHNSRGCYQPL